ncbi:MAG TPA: MBL fold metallo-hydrolase [Moorella mulderi]|nr:MBL fold metallo-hydrolase [Moorella mulderi]
MIKYLEEGFYMELISVDNRTYVIPGGTNVGVFRIGERDCILIDTGLQEGMALRIRRCLEAKGWKPLALLTTHAHGDHFGAHGRLQELYPEMEIYAPPEERPFMSNPLLWLYVLYGAHPFAQLQVPVLLPPRLEEEKLSPLVPGNFRYPLEVLKTPGHTLGHTAFLTPEGVLFCGDALIHPQFFKSYPLPLVQNLSAQLETLKSIESLSPQVIVPSHGSWSLPCKDLVKANRDQIEFIMEKLLALLKEQPLTREELLSALGITREATQYLLYHSSLGAFLSFLVDKGEVGFALERGKMCFSKV